MNPQITPRLRNLAVGVTGAQGFIGRHLVSALSRASCDVRVLEGDVTDASMWDASFDVLFHLAAAMPGAFAEDPRRGYGVNVDGTLNALEACRRNKARIVFASTCGIYRPDLQGALTEESPIGPSSPYAASKRLAELLCEAYSTHHGVEAMVLRLFNVYGVGQKDAFLVPYLLNAALSGKTATVYHLDSARDFIHVTDVVEALVVAATAEDCGVYNIGTGTATSVRQVLDCLETILRRPVPWKQGTGPGDPHPATHADNAKARVHLGWAPSIDVLRGLTCQVETVKAGYDS